MCLFAFMSGNTCFFIFCWYRGRYRNCFSCWSHAANSIHPNKSLKIFYSRSNKGFASRVGQNWFPYLILHTVLSCTAVPQHQAALILQRYPMETFYKLHYADRRGAKFSTCRKRAKKERWMEGRYSKFIRFSHWADKADACPGVSSHDGGFAELTRGH